MEIPTAISISKKVRDSFQTIKNRTGVPNNVLSRIAIMLAINSGIGLDSVVKDDAGGQTLSRDLLFGDLLETFDVLVREYIHQQSVQMPVGQVVSSLIEVGAHKMAHCRSLNDLCALGHGMS
jgi:DNA sulfur modification protein DndE